MDKKKPLLIPAVAGVGALGLGLGAYALGNKIQRSGNQITDALNVVRDLSHQEDKTHYQEAIENLNREVFLYDIKKTLQKGVAPALAGLGTVGVGYGAYGAYKNHKNKTAMNEFTDIYLNTFYKKANLEDDYGIESPGGSSLAPPTPPPPTPTPPPTTPTPYQFNPMNALALAGLAGAGYMGGKYLFGNHKKEEKEAAFTDVYLTTFLKSAGWNDYLSNEMLEAGSKQNIAHAMSNVGGANGFTFKDNTGIPKGPIAPPSSFQNAMGAVNRPIQNVIQKGLDALYTSPIKTTIGSVHGGPIQAMRHPDMQAPRVSQAINSYENSNLLNNSLNILPSLSQNNPNDVNQNRLDLFKSRTKLAPMMQRVNRENFRDENPNTNVPMSMRSIPQTENMLKRIGREEFRNANPNTSVPMSIR